MALNNATADEIKKLARMSSIQKENNYFTWPHHKLCIIRDVYDEYGEMYSFEDFKKNVSFTDLFDIVIHGTPIHFRPTVITDSGSEEEVTNPWMLHRYLQCVMPDLLEDINDICQFFGLDFKEELEASKKEAEDLPSTLKYTYVDYHETFGMDDTIYFERTVFIW